MKKQTQLYTDMGGPVLGDCWRTAIACVLDLDRDEVPHFVQEHPEEGPEWFHATVRFVEQAQPGLTLRCIDPVFPVYAEPENGPEYVIISGRSPRGDWLHSVVGDARTGATVWDPHPDRTGILSRDDVMVLVAK